MCEILTIYSDVLRLFLELSLDIGEAFQQKGIERAAFPVQDHPHGSLVGERLFVAALTGQGVVHIGQGDDLRADGDVIALEAVRVAPAICSRGSSSKFSSRRNMLAPCIQWVLMTSNSSLLEIVFGFCATIFCGVG